MGAPLNERDMRLLTEVLAGDRRVDDAEVAAAARSNEAFRSSLRELRALQECLDADGERERVVMAEALEGTGGDAPEVGSRLRRLAAAGKPAAPRRWPAWAAVAAAAVLLVILFRAFGGPQPDDRRSLGDPRLQLAAPTVSGDIVRLQWSCSVPAAVFTVHLFDPEDPDRAIAGGQSGELTETTWTLDRDFVLQQPQETRWRVVARYRGRRFSADAPLR